MLKFRVFNRSTMKMYLCNDVAIQFFNGNWRYGELKNNCSGDYKAPLDDSNSVPMQFTGLHDKDGKEIYESDIVQYFDKKTGIPEDDKSGIINYSTTKAVWCIGDFNLGETIMYCGVENIKIIGNIYENPGLLSEVE